MTARSQNTIQGAHTAESVIEARDPRIGHGRVRRAWIFASVIILACFAVWGVVSASGSAEAQVPRYGSVSISGPSSITVDTTEDYTITTTGIPSSTVSYYHVEVTTDGDISEEDDCSNDVSWQYNPGSGTDSEDITIEGCSVGDGTITATLYFTVVDLGEVSEVASSDKDVDVVSETAPPQPTPTPDPVISISADDSRIDEGDDAEFTVEAEGTLSSNLTVAIQVRSVGSFISGTRPRSVTVYSSNNRGTISITTRDDSNDEADGSITVELLDGNDYDLDSSNDSASVTVRDNDLPIPSISISAKRSSITEGTDAEFTVTASRTLDADLTVRVRVTQEGTYTDDTGTRSVTIDDGDRSASFEINTDDDSVDETNGEITATIRSGTGYSVGSPSSDSVTVRDNDPSRPDDPTGVSVSRSDTGPADGNVTVRWNSVDGAAKYRVQRRSSGGTYSTVESNTTSRSVTLSAPCGTTYYFRVAAYGDGTGAAEV